MVQHPKQLALYLSLQAGGKFGRSLPARRGCVRVRIDI